MLRLPGVERKSSEALSDGASPASDGSGPMKVTVKNTFIEMSPELTDDMRAVQSCTARLSDPSPQFSSDPTPKSGGDPTPESSIASGGNHFPVPDFTSETKSHASGSSGSREFSTIIKNTFIEIHDDMESPLASDRNIQSCTARLSAPNPTFQLDGISEESQYAAAGGYSHAQLSAAPPLGTPQGLSPHAPEFRMTVKNTFIDFQGAKDFPVDSDSPGNLTCMARLADPSSSFMQPTPAHKSETIAEDNLVFPPTPQTVGGSFSQSLAAYGDVEGHPKPLLLTKPRSQLDDVESSCPTADSRTPTAVPLVSGNSPTSPVPPPPEYAAPNDLTNIPNRFAQPPPGPPLHAAGSSGAKIATQAQKADLVSATIDGSKPSIAPSTAEDWPSLGSKLHGTIGADGKPACKPCAWFYKDGSCTNAKGCGYCHLCPQGELKNRKKSKIALLRKAEAEAGASPTNKSTSSVSPKSDAGADKKGKFVFSLQSHLPS